MSDERHLVVCYDCADDSRRNRLSRTLLDYGTRIQESVFECLADDGLVDQMMGRVRDICQDWPEDRVHVFELCTRCAERTVTIGSGVRVEPFRYRLV